MYNKKTILTIKKEKKDKKKKKRFQNILSKLFKWVIKRKKNIYEDKFEKKCIIRQKR